MAVPAWYRLDPNEPAAVGIPRVLRTDLDAAIHAAQAVDPEEAVHEIRKAGKRLRAAIGLGAPGLSRHDVKALTQGIRDASRRLAEARDAHVARDLLVEVGAAGNVEVPPPDVVRASLLATAADLRAVQAHLDEVDASGMRSHHLVVGYRDTYTQARLRRCATGAHPEELHDWRKAVKTHLFHLALLRDCWPAVMDALACEADVLQEVLGDRNDLATLLRLGPSDPVLHAELEARGAALELQAWRIGERLFARSPRQQARWLERLIHLA